MTEEANLRDLLQHSQAVSELARQARNPTYLRDFEEFELQRIIIFEESLLLAESLPNRYLHYLTIVEERRIAIQSPFPDHAYWTQEAAA